MLIPTWFALRFPILWYLCDGLLLGYNSIDLSFRDHLLKGRL